MIKKFIHKIKKIFCKHHAVYDDKWCQWYCTKCGNQLFKEDLPLHTWKYLNKKVLKKK